MSVVEKLTPPLLFFDSDEAGFGFLGPFDKPPLAGFGFWAAPKASGASESAAAALVSGFAGGLLPGWEAPLPPLAPPCCTCCCPSARCGKSCVRFEVSGGPGRWYLPGGDGVLLFALGEVKVCGRCWGTTVLGGRGATGAAGSAADAVCWLLGGRGELLAAAVVPRPAATMGLEGAALAGGSSISGRTDSSHSCWRSSSSSSSDPFCSAVYRSFHIPMRDANDGCSETLPIPRAPKADGAGGFPVGETALLLRLLSSETSTFRGGMESAL
mmetsp:Transcript_53025/g.91049  ORF Transcript_53025/g.91049 Transcript_53025/m.91049 type:complete len:270 (+) Transcript_53025:326-1135(+)